MKRLGLRKVAAVAVDTKVGAGADTAVSFVARKATDAVNFVGRKTGLSKLKVDASGKGKRRKTNDSIAAKTEQFKRNMIEQEARDIQAQKDWEREKAEGLEQMDRDIRNRFPVDDVHVPKV
jgi:hypothetical protein